MRSAPLVLATLLLTLAACGSNQTPGAGPAAQPKPITPACPQHVPTAFDPGPASPLVPGTPAAAQACHYAGRDTAGTAKDALVKSAPVGDVKTLVTALNAAQTTAPKMIYNCPMDDASTDLLMFTYTDRKPVTVEVKPTGCATATNGTEKAWLIRSNVLEPLRALVGS